jgi:hypothetical protein
VVFTAILGLEAYIIAVIQRHKNNLEIAAESKPEQPPTANRGNPPVAPPDLVPRKGAIPPVSSVPRKTESNGQSKLEIVETQQIPMMNKISGLHSYAMNVFYADTGALAITAMTRRLAVRIKATDLTPEEEKSAEEESFQVAPPGLGDQKNGMQPGREPPRHFFSFPDDDQTFEIFLPYAQDILDGKLRLYLFNTFKYRDDALPAGMIRITQSCGWFSETFEVAHTCGINRIYTARIK